MRLYINGQLIYDFESTSVLQTNTPCVTLASGQPHEIYFYFAAMVRRVRGFCYVCHCSEPHSHISRSCITRVLPPPQLNSTAPVGIQWANCSSPNQPVVTSTNYVSFSSA